MSVYRVNLPSVDLTASPELAERLLGDGTPWARDLFSDDASLELGSLAGRGGSDSRGIVTSPDGDTLVLVRNSSGVQIGNGNVQRDRSTHGSMLFCCRTIRRPRIKYPLWGRSYDFR